jgi:hypothetical protein
MSKTSQAREEREARRALRAARNAEINRVIAMTQLGHVEQS